MTKVHLSRRTRLRFGASMAVIAAGLFAAGAAQAQDTDATEVEEIVVTGFRGSLASALSAKREETAIVNSIKAEDIADFPDANLVEAIQRIPGVSIDRDAGEGRTMTVRGLGPDFTRTRINGMEAQATAGGTDSSGGANRGRGFDFNVFASELFNSVTVRKTQSAEIEEGSLGATVDLRTTRPFDFKGPKIGGSIQYGYNDLSEEWDPRFAVLLSNTFLDGKLGILGSLAYSERNLLEEGFSAVRWERASDNGGFQNPAALPGGAGNAANLFHPRLPRFGQLIHDQKRTGFTGAIQYRPWESTTFSYDLLFSKLDAKRTKLPGVPVPEPQRLGGRQAPDRHRQRQREQRHADLGRLQRRRCAQRAALRRDDDGVHPAHLHDRARVHARFQHEGLRRPRGVAVRQPDPDDGDAGSPGHRRLRL